MKAEIFISYSDFDKDKVDLIVSELEGNIKFAPLVIASNREALKPLAKKVADGIINAKVIVPILTRKSFTTQWINQEIGFATALNKKVIPIVESDLINDLKGFIHKQIDLPYNFPSSTNRAKEHKDFINCFRLLLSDLERDFEALGIIEELPEKSEFEKSLEQADKLNEELEFQQKRHAFLNSPDGVTAAKLDVLNMYADIKEKIKKLQEKKFYFGFEEETYNPSFILKSEGFSFSIAWQLQYGNSLEGATLFVRRWKGHLTKEGGAVYFHGEEPKMLADNKYDFDRDRNGNICWLNRADKKQYTAEQIVDSCLHWIVEQVSKKRLDRNR